MPQALTGAAEPGWAKMSRKKGLPKRSAPATSVRAISQRTSWRSIRHQLRRGRWTAGELGAVPAVGATLISWPDRAAGPSSRRRNRQRRRWGRPRRPPPEGDEDREVEHQYRDEGGDLMPLTQIHRDQHHQDDEEAAVEPDAVVPSLDRVADRKAPDRSPRHRATRTVPVRSIR